MIINIRGTNGSGKSTLVRQLMERFGRVPVPNVEGKEIGYYAEPIDTYVVGRYTTACGGCDTIKTQDETKSRITQFQRNGGNVVFEGILVSTIFGPWLEFSRKHGGMIWAFLDTPLDLCLARVQQRNGGKPVKTDQIKGKWETIRRIYDKARSAGEQVVWLNHLDPLTDLVEVMAPAVLRKVA